MKEKIKEFIKKRWYFILGILLLILSFAISVVFYIKFDKCSNKEQPKCEPCVETKCEEVKCDSGINDTSEDEGTTDISEDEGTNDITTTITKFTDFGELYTYDTKGILKNGYLTGKWYTEELKNIKFVGLTGINDDIAKYNFAAISEDGERYNLEYCEDEDYCEEEGEIEFSKNKINVKGKITKVEVYKSRSVHFPFGIFHTVLTIDGKKCIVSIDNVDVTLEEATYNCNDSFDDYYKENGRFMTGVGYQYDDKRLGQIEVSNDGFIYYDSDEYITFSYNSKPLKVEYTIFQDEDDNFSILYVVSTDNKLYEISEIDNSRVKLLGDIKNIDVSGKYGSRLMEIKLTDGSVYKFVDNFIE